MANSKNKSTTSHLCPCRHSPPLSLMSPSHPATYSFTSRSSSSSSTASLFSRATSPTRVNMYSRNYQLNSLQSSSPVRLSVDHPTSPGRPLSMRRQSSAHSVVANKKRTCACSPTTHPGSFRCAFHRNSRRDNRGGGSQSASCYSGSRLNFRRSAMANSIVRIGGVEGDLVKRALSALIRPSSHHLRRRSAFEPSPSRLSVVTAAEAESEES